jgi:hypothetical protein
MPRRSKRIKMSGAVKGFFARPKINKMFLRKRDARDFL